MRKTPPTKAALAHMAAVKCLPCCICGKNAPSEAHHITRWGRKLGDFFTIPLCEEDHRGDRGFSGVNRSAWDKSFHNVLRLLRLTYLALEKAMPQEVIDRIQEEERITGCSLA